MKKIDFELIKNTVRKEIGKSKNLEELNQIFKEYLGKKGRVSLILRSLKQLPERERRKIGREANELKKFLREEIEKKKEKLCLVDFSAEEKEKVDVTVPGRKLALGHLHPLTLVKREIGEIFQGMGFAILDGPEIETEWYNFDALNIPKNHPARDAWDTLWLKPESRKSEVESRKLLLRTHTSPMQARYMEKHKPPLRIIVPGKVFRHEATDASHEFQFYQIEGLMVDKNISVSHLKAVVAEFFKRFFRRELKFRFNPDFFPFTEPSFNVEMTCLACEGQGCSVCKKTGWLEVAGAGMVHPNVFRACRLDSEKWQGWAFGFGWDRLAMMKYKIDDIRLFNSGDLRFLKQF